MEMKPQSAMSCPVLSSHSASDNVTMSDELKPQKTTQHVKLVSSVHAHPPVPPPKSEKETATHSVANYWFPFRFCTNPPPIDSLQRFCTLQLLFKITTNANITVNCAVHNIFHRLN